MGRLVLFLIALVISTPLRCEPASLWSHNGSTMGLYADGIYRAFRYHTPRQGMRQEGVREGTLLFEGYRSGDTYSGTAYIFSRRCGAVPYQASGRPAADEQSLTLYGMAPAGLSAACQITGYRRDVLRFDLLTVLAPPPATEDPEIAAEPEPEYRPSNTTVVNRGDVVPTTADTQSPIAASSDTPSRLESIPRSLIWMIGVVFLLAAASLIGGSHPAPVTVMKPAALGGSPGSHPPSSSPAPAANTPTHPNLASLKAMTMHPPPVPDASSVIPPASAVGFDKIYLKLRRSQRIGVLGSKAIFTLDARVDLGSQEQALIAKYRLGSLIVYDSKARRARNEEALGHYQDAYVSSYTSVGRMTWQGLKGLTASAIAALTLRITIDGLVRGQNIECKELDELIAAENAIREACETLRAYLDTALTFDGRETILEY